MQTDTQYPLSWRLLHWLIALLVLGLIPVGLWMTTPGIDDVWNLYGAHKAVGFTVLWLMVLRLVIRLRTGPPPYPLSMPTLLATAARVLHRVLYVLLLAIPLLGWAGVTAYPALITVAGLNLPAMPFIPQNKDLSGQLFAIHGTLALVLGAFILMHIGAALKHLLLNRDRIFQRMWFGK